MSLERAYLLYEQSRYAQAEQELRRSLVETPQDAETQAMLALCLAEQKQYAEATEAATVAVQQSPDWSFPYYALASVLYERDRYSEAEAAIATAIRLNPVNEAHYGLQASIYFGQQRWQEALTAAEMGLKIDPEYSSCLNLRAAALVKLNRSQEAAETVEAALQHNPDSAVTHASQGWVWLEQGRYNEAMGSFREALRLDPGLEWARQGIVYALKARNPVYSLMLRYFLWMSKLTPQVRWGVIFGGWFLMRSLRTVARNNPDLASWITPVLMLYLLFVLLSWIADPLFNLLLRLDRYGRLVLSKDEVAASNWVGGLLGGAIALFILGVLLKSNGLFVGTATLMLLVIPMSAIFSCEGQARRWMMFYTLGLVGLVAVGGAIALAQRNLEAAVIPLALFFLGVLASSFLANILIQQTPQK